MSAAVLAPAAALVLAGLAALVLLKESRQGRVPLALGLMLLATVELFDGLAGSGGERFPAYKRLVLVGKSLVPVAFLLYGTAFTRKGDGGSRLFAVAPLLVIGAVFAAGALWLPFSEFFSDARPDGGALHALGPIGYWFYLGLMIFCIAALVNLESVYAGVSRSDRGRVKYEFLGAGAILAASIFYFSQGLLYRAVNTGLQPVRSGVTVAGALLIGYSRLYRGRTTSLAVSRQALFRSFTLVAIGIYLLVLGFLGEAARRLGVSMTENLPVVIAVLSGLAFLVLLLSEEIRRRLKVLIAKHFYAQKHDYREAWLYFSNALAVCRSLEEVRSAIIERYEKLFGLQFASLYVREGPLASFALAATRDRDGQPRRVELTAGLLGYFEQTGRVMKAGDGEYTPTDAEAAFVSESGAWLLVPLIVGERLEAFVVCGRQIVREKLTYEDFDLMKVIGRQAVLSLKNFQLAEELTEAREMAAVAKVSSFVIHDLKNLAYTFSLMMENADEHIAEPDFQRDLVASIQGTVAKMNALIAKLKAFPEKMALSRGRLDVAGLTREVVDEVQALKKSISFATDLAPARANVDGQELRKVVLNLLLNACDAVGAEGAVRVSTGRGDGHVVIRVQDNGRGMSEAFVQSHLFKPFRTTKEKGLGIGLYQCKQIVEAHGGRIEVASREGEGTVFTVVVPEEGGAAA